MNGHTVFDTQLGACGIGWTELGVRTVQLPDRDAARTAAARLRGVVVDRKSVV